MATRDLTDAFAAAVSQRFGVVCHLFELEFSGGTFRFTTAPVDISWNGYTWSAVGGNLSHGGVTETREFSAQAVRITLDGVSQAVISALLGQSYIGRDAKIYQCYIAPDDNLVTYSFDFSTYSQGNSPVLTADVDGPYGDTAYNVEDASGSLRANIASPVLGAFVIGGSKCIAIDVRQGTSPPANGSSFALYDNTAGQYRAWARIEWPGPELTIINSNGSIVGVFHHSVDWHRVVLKSDAVTAGNDHRIYLYPAHEPTETGDIDATGFQCVDHDQEPRGYAATDGAAVQGGSIVIDPYQIFGGYLNSNIKVIETGKTCRIETQLVSSLAKFDQQRGLRASLAAHQDVYSGDTFWRHITAIYGRQTWWGPRPQSGRGGGGGDDGSDNWGGDGDPPPYIP